MNSNIFKYLKVKNESTSIQNIVHIMNMVAGATLIMALCFAIDYYITH